MDDLVPDYDALPTGHAAPAPPHRSLQWARIAVSLAFFVNGAAFACWVSRIPTIRHSLGLSDGQLGLAFFGLAGGALIGFPLSGLACARYGNRAVTIFFAFIYCAVLALIPHATHLEGLIVVLALFGIGHGGMDVAMNANGVDVEHRYGRSIMSSLHGMYSLGGLTGAVIGLGIASLQIDPRWHLLGGAVLLAGVVLFLSPRMLSVPPTRTGQGYPTFALPSKSLFAIGAIVTCAFLCEGAMGDWSGVYLHDTLKTSHGFAVAGYVVFSLMMTIARFSGDAVLTRWGPVRVLQISGLIAALGFSAALISGNPIVALIGFGCIGLGMSTVAPIGFGTAGRSPDMAPGAAIAAVATMGYTGFLVGPPFIGLLADKITLRWALGVVALLSFAIFALAGNAKAGPAEKADLGEANAA